MAVALARKARTPAPPKRKVQAPQVRNAPRTPRDEARSRMILYVLAVSGFVMVAIVGAIFLLAGGSDSKAATNADDAVREAGGTVQTVQAAPNFMLNGKKLPYRHLPNGVLPKGFHYSTNPPTSGIHTNETVIYGIYDQSVPTISSVHNLEHGGVVIRYGPQVPQSEVSKIADWYLQSPNGLVVAPMAGLGNKIALSAWTYDLNRQNDRNYEGEGHLAELTKFDEDAFNAFLDAYRGKGPERFKVSDLQPGGP
jgi:Protein of unknown function (DUF3105)